MNITVTKTEKETVNLSRDNMVDVFYSVLNAVGDWFPNYYIQNDKVWWDDWGYHGSSDAVYVRDATQMDRLCQELLTKADKWKRGDN